MHILVTNEDADLAVGIDIPAARPVRLANASLVAPERVSSATGRSLTLLRQRAIQPWQPWRDTA